MPRSCRQLLLAVLAPALGLCAQGDFQLDRITPGTLGSPLALRVAGAPPSAIGAWAVSVTRGPTPLSSFDPGDTRSLQVGLELSGAWTLLLTDGTGAAALNLNLPLNPAYAGIVWHWQAPLLATSGPRLIGQISNGLTTQLGYPALGVLAPALLGTARGFGASLFDRDNNGGAGDVLITGGGAGSLTSSTGLQSTELWDFRRMQRLPGPAMTTARALHLAVPLADGRTLLVGGVDATGNALASCEVYDPATNSFTATGSMATPRALHAACLLADGRVMVAGGTSSLADTTAAITNVLGSVEFWSPTTGLWASGPALGGRRLAPALVRLANNQVMVSGGVEVTFLFGVPISAISTNAVQRWNPATNAWTNGPNMPNGRAGHQYNAVTLDDNRVLLTGGTYVPNLLGAASATPIAAADVYNPTTNSWASHSMATARALHSATKLADGRVVVCGGAQGTLTTPVPIADVELFTPATNTWTGLPPLLAPRAGHSAERTPDGMVVLFGGQDLSATTATIETLRF